MWLLLTIILNNTYYENLMFAGTAMCTVICNVMCLSMCNYTPYNIVLQIHVQFELLTATVELNYHIITTHMQYTRFGLTLFFIGKYILRTVFD